MSVAKCAFSSSAPSSEGKYRQHGRKCDYPRAAAGPEPDQWLLALWLTQSASGPLYILLKHSPGIYLYDMANQLSYINLNLKHLPSKYNSLQYSSGKKPKEDGKDKEMAHGAQKTTSERVNPWEVNEIISLLFHLASSPVPGFLFGRRQSLFSPTFCSFGKCDKGYFSIIF